MTPDSQQSQIARLQQQVADLREVVGRFGQMLTDQVRMEERFNAAVKRIDELEDDRDKMDQLRRDAKRNLTTTLIAVVAVLISLGGLIVTILAFTAGH